MAKCLGKELKIKSPDNAMSPVDIYFGRKTVSGKARTGLMPESARSEN